MKTTVRLICSAILALLIVSAFCVIASAEENDYCADKEYRSFYVPDEEQEELYELLNASDDLKMKRLLDVRKLSFVKGSIAPMYCFDLEETAKTDKIVLKRRYDRDAEYRIARKEIEDEVSELIISGERDVEREKEILARLEELEHRSVKCGVYAVKLLMETGEDAGSLMFCIEDGKARMIGSLYDSAAYSALYEKDEKAFAWGSLSYADQAERIRQMLGLPDIVSPDFVKMSFIDGYGPAFYVKTSDTEAVVPVSNCYREGSERTQNSGSGYYDAYDFCGIARDYAERMEAHRKMISEIPPDEKGNVVFIGHEPVVRFIRFTESNATGMIENVTDIKGYFEGKASVAALSAPDAGTTGKTEESPANIWLPVGAAAAIIAVFAAGAVIFIKKKAK